MAAQTNFIDIATIWLHAGKGEMCIRDSCCVWMPITPAQRWNDKWVREVQGAADRFRPVYPLLTKGQKEESDKIWR